MDSVSKALGTVVSSLRVVEDNKPEDIDDGTDRSGSVEDVQAAATAEVPSVVGGPNPGNQVPGGITGPTLPKKNILRHSPYHNHHHRHHHHLRQTQQQQSSNNAAPNSVQIPHPPPPPQQQLQQQQQQIQQNRPLNFQPQQTTQQTQTDANGSQISVTSSSAIVGNTTIITTKTPSIARGSLPFDQASADLQQTSAALLADRYILLDVLDGGAALYKCIDVKSKEEFVCKVSFSCKLLCNIGMTGERKGIS